MYDAVDVFPIHFSESLEKLSYPEHNFKYWANDPDIKVFVLFTNSDNVVYYSKKSLTEQYMNNVLSTGRESKRFIKFYPRNINFKKLANRYRIDPCDQGKKNADVRLGYKLRNAFLVKAFFTFGLRTVARGSAHVIQTLNAPLLLYIIPKIHRNLARIDEKVFPFQDLNVYDLSILPPHGVYRIPPGTRYVLLSTQKNFFAFDMVPESMQIPFAYEDPVKHKITKLTHMFDQQRNTPYIEHVDLEEFDEPQESENGDSVFSEFFKTEPFKVPMVPPQQQQQQQEFEPIHDSNETMQNSNKTSTPTTMNEPNNASQQITYWLIPQNPPQQQQPVLERNVVVSVTPDFAESYQSLKNKIVCDPRKILFPVNPDEPNCDPIDLTCCGGNENCCVENENGSCYGGNENGICYGENENENSICYGENENMSCYGGNENENSICCGENETMNSIDDTCVENENMSCYGGNENENINCIDNTSVENISCQGGNENYIHDASEENISCQGGNENIDSIDMIELDNLISSPVVPDEEFKTIIGQLFSPIEEE